jgi:hypothetical protein
VLLCAAPTCLSGHHGVGVEQPPAAVLSWNVQAGSFAALVRPGDCMHGVEWSLLDRQAAEERPAEACMGKGRDGF